MEDQLNPKHNEIALIAQNAGLAPMGVENLLKRFAAYFNEAKKIADESKDIVVTDETQVELMTKAREKRLSLKSLRVEVEKVRVELKEQSLREGKAIDGVSNLIKALIVPVEEHLEKQEKYAEIRELERIQKKYEERVVKLTPYVDDITLYNIKDMSDVAFENLFIGCKKSFDDKKAAEAKLEEDRIAEEKRQKLFNERRLELAPYRDFLPEGAINLLDMSETDYQAFLAKGKAGKKSHDDEQEKVRIEAEATKAQLEKERKAREEAEAKLKAEKDAQAKKEAEAKVLEDLRKEEEDEKKRKALLAPDKEKLIELAGTIDKITLPAVSSKEAGDVLNEVQSKLTALSSYLREKSKTL